MIRDVQEAKKAIYKYFKNDKKKMKKEIDCGNLEIDIAQVNTDSDINTLIDWVAKDKINFEFVDAALEWGGTNITALELFKNAQILKARDIIYEAMDEIKKELGV